jgi:Tfp pilus assembly protein PilF
LLAALIALLVATPMIPSESAAQFGTGIVLVMLHLVLLVVWLVTALATERPELRMGWTGAAIVVFLLLVSTSALVIVVTGGGNARPAINMLWQWISFGVSFFLLRQTIRTPSECRALCAVMVALAVGLAVYGYYQYFYAMPTLRAQYQRDPEKVLRESNIDAPPGTPARKQFESRLSSVEPIATFALTNSLAGLLAPWLIAALGIAAAGWPDRQHRALATAGVVYAAVLISGCLLLTKSRSAWLATAMGVVLIALYGRQRGRTLDWRIPICGAAMLVFLSLAAVVFGGLDTQVLSEAPKSLLYRFQYWQATAAMIVDNPWFGCGPGNFQTCYTAYKLPEASETVADPHNFLLEVWATAGTPALFALLAVLGAFIWQLWRATAAQQTFLHSLGVTRDSGAKGSGAVRSIYAGAVAGLLFAYPCSWLVGYALEEVELPFAVRLPAVWIVGLPAAVVWIVLVHRWVLGGRLPVSVPVIALAVLLVSLLAAGGIGFPGVAQSLWVLLAAALNIAETPRPSAARWKRTLMIGLLVLATLLAAACYLTAYQPVLRAAALLGQASQFQSQGEIDAADEACEQAAQRDPFSAEPWRMRALLALQRWQQTGADSDFQRFETFVAELVRRDPRSSQVRKEIGNWYLIAFDARPRVEYIRSAIAWYRAAVERYPNSNILHAQLASTYARAGDRPAAQREAEIALQLDAQLPHKEQKLREQTVFDPGRSDRSSDRTPATLGGEEAEQLMRRLRTASGSED